MNLSSMTIFNKGKILQISKRDSFELIFDALESQILTQGNLKAESHGRKEPTAHEGQAHALLLSGSWLFGDCTATAAQSCNMSATGSHEQFH